MSADIRHEPDRDATRPTVSAAPTVEAPTRAVKELRLGLVCYGGVSLAIYMHGMTKEIHRAIRASVLEERGLASDAGAASELAYRELLDALHTERKVHTRIVVDAIAGSSAGGINGIFLAKALAHDLSQDALRDLWFEHGDLGKIIRKPKKRLGRLARWIAKPLIRGDAGDVPDEAAKEALVGAALEIREQPLLDGDEMSNRIYSALAGMKPASPELGSLMPARHPLDLTVTVTDHWGYPRRLPIADPPVIAEGQHRHLLKFGYHTDRRNDFGDRQNGALSLAARATSSLPLGFQPVHAGDFPSVLPPNATSWDDIKPFFRAYPLAQARGDRAHLVDGGVLDNKPFGPVIREIKRRHAANEVDRYLIFLEPDPTVPGPQRERAPKPFEALIGALSGLPRSESILDELAEVLATNERVRAVRDVIEANWDPVAVRVREVLPDLDEPPTDPSDPRLAKWNKDVHAEAARLGEFTYAAYLRLKISSAIDSFAEAASLVCDYTDASNQAFLVRDLIRGWARRRKLFEHEGSPTEAQQAFVQRFDLGFAQRRLHFVIAGVSWLYREADQPGRPTRNQLDTVKERLYEAVARLEWLASGHGYAGEAAALAGRAAAVRSAFEKCFAQQRLDAYIAEKVDLDKALDGLSDDLDAVRERLDEYLEEQLDGFSGQLYLDLLAEARDWPVESRRILLIRYLAFPIWDSMLYPLQALSDVAERDEVRIARMSPADSTLLEPVHEEAKTGKGGKVLGAGLGHAYAFFSRRAREHDYLWGRLDAAERIVGLLLTTTEMVDGDPKVVLGREHEDYNKWCKRAFRAVLAEDTKHLPTIAGDVAKLKEQVERLAEKPATA
jgi:patatin-related protein